MLGVTHSNGGYGFSVSSTKAPEKFLTRKTLVFSAQIPRAIPPIVASLSIGVFTLPVCKPSRNVVIRELRDQEISVATPIIENVRN